MTDMSENIEDFDIIEILKILWAQKILIISLTSFFAIFSVFYALSIPNSYTSSALLKVTEQSDNNGGRNLSELASRYGGLASIAGISMPSSGVDSAIYAIEIIKSRDFAKHLMTFPNIKQNLMATKSYDNISRGIIYDPKIYDQDKDTWIRKDSGIGSPEPSYIEVHDTALKDLSASKDEITGLITISFEHLSPVFAQDFVLQGFVGAL